MSDIRLQGSGFQPGITTQPPHSFRGPLAMPQAEEPSFADGVASPFFSGTPLQLFNAHPSRLASNPEGAEPLVRAQADTASTITGPVCDENGLNPDGSLCDFKPAELTGKGASTIASTGGLALEKAGRNSGKLGSKLGVFGPGAGLIGEAAALPGNFNIARNSVGQAIKTGKKEDVIKAGGDTASFASGATSMAKSAAELPEAILKGKASGAAKAAFRQKAPAASRAVVNAAGKKAAEEAMKETSTAVARKAVTKAATIAAKESGTVAKGAGVVGRSAARAVLNRGGVAAAEAAGHAVARSGLKIAAKAGGRFVPGMNIAIAAFDTAAAAATLADKKAGVGKKAAACVTAVGSIVAATNIPVVSQVGAVVSAVSSFAGAFLN